MVQAITINDVSHGKPCRKSRILGGRAVKEPMVVVLEVGIVGGTNVEGVDCLRCGVGPFLYAIVVGLGILHARIYCLISCWGLNGTDSHTWSTRG